jgi:Protein of unknown function (DUF3300)
MKTATSVGRAISSLLFGALVLQGCTPASTPGAPSATTADTSAASSSIAGNAASVADLTGPVADAAATTTSGSYAPPSAAQLIQLLAPVAVFPDTLVAQVLAASAHPDQIGTAYAWYQRNNGLKGTGLQNAIDQQDWDPSVKAITSFPDVLHQMASNLPWTTALGEAYVNDPTDVMNAIQSLRQQAMACNNLKSNQYLKVSTVPKTNAPPPAQFADDDAPPTYAGPPVIPAPEQIIEIAPARPDYVYVPQYDPNVFYGTPIMGYPGYAYAWPTPIYAGPLFGAFGFGLGIGIDFGHPWGWGRWGVHWGPGFGRPGYGFHGPAVVYNNHGYFGHSPSIVNHFAGRGPANFAGQPALHAGVNGPASHSGETVGAHAGTNDFRGMSSPHFESSMAAHTNTFQTRHAPLSAGVARAGELPSAHFAPASATHAGMTTSPAAMRTMQTRSPMALANAQRGVSPQTFGNHVQMAPSRNGNFSSAQHYSAPGGQRGYTPNSAPRSIANTQRVQAHVAQAPRGVPHATNVSHGGGHVESGRHR